jgi:hypothetical protein
MTSRAGVLYDCVGSRALSRRPLIWCITARTVLTGVSTLNSVAVRFNEPRLVSDAGLLLAGTLAGSLGIEELVNESVWLGYGTPGAALPGRQVMTPVHGMLAARTALTT